MPTDRLLFRGQSTLLWKIIPPSVSSSAAAWEPIPPLTAIYGGGGITIGTAYIARNVRTTINNSNVDGYIYGGITSVIGNAAPNTLYGTTYVTISGDSVINAQVYGGNRYSSSVAGTSAVSKSANLTIRRHLQQLYLRWRYGVGY